MYPFTQYPARIDALTPGDLYLQDTNQVGDFFWWIAYQLKDLGYLRVYPTVFRRAAEQVDVFKELLRVVVDERQSVVEKVDASWEDIKGMGGDKHVAKKIIYCFNDELLPIFRTKDLILFYRQVVDEEFPYHFYQMSIGEQFHFLNQALIQEQQNHPETNAWDVAYFMWFLYVTYKW